MLQKPDNDAIDQVRGDNRVREVIDFYREFVRDDDEVLPLLKFAGKRFFGTRFDPKFHALKAAIGRIAKVYQEVTGKSLKTWDPATGELLFSTFAKELFEREGLKPPTGYAIKQALKKNK